MNRLKKIKGILYFFISFHVMYVHSQDGCIDHGYVPRYGSRKPLPSSVKIYYEGAVLRYSCMESYHLDPAIKNQTCRGHQWSPLMKPYCVSSISTTSPTVTTEEPTNMYCPYPPPIEHGAYLCCPPDTVLPDFCCSVGSKVQFECNPGYSMRLNDGQPEWACSEHGRWINSSTPVCVEDSITSAPHLSQSPFSDGMIKTVAGVAAGVLSLLLLVIALAFCKPRLKEMKRRWRDFREDENGLIVNGQRVTLPSYEEATTSNVRIWGETYDQIPPSRRLNSLSANVSSSTAADDVTRPPESNVTVDDVMILPVSSSYDAPAVLNHSQEYDTWSPERMERSYDFQSSASRVLTLPSRDDLSVNDFLREVPCSSRHMNVIHGFEDDFVPISTYSNNQVVPPQSPSLSLSSTEGVLAPLLEAPSASAHTSDVILKQTQQISHSSSNRDVEDVVNETLEYVDYPDDVESTKEMFSFLDEEDGTDVGDETSTRLGQFTVDDAAEPIDDRGEHIELCEDNHTDSTAV